MEQKNTSQSNVTDAESKRVKPTLFIGLGGTGAEVIMRLRRRIVSEFWGKNRVRLDTVSEFPAARFLHIDLDQKAMSGTEQSSDTDPLGSAVKLLQSERVVDNLDFEAYQKGNRMEYFPHIRNWYPADRLRDLQIDTSTGAGQIRAISRLYFYDKFTQIRAAVEGHLRQLQAGVSHQQALTRLGLDTGADRRVVIIGSGAGGTGSGSFLDMGFLAKALNVSPTGPVDLILFLPSGYSGANQQATEANSYAALMELDACMSNSVRYVHPQYGWGPEHEDILPGAESRPFDSMFLVDTKNMADVVTNSVRDVYHMIADILFEDFMPGDFADAKRSIDVNQKRHRALPLVQSLGDDTEGAKEMYPRSYSTIGQCTLESPQNMERFARHLRESQERVRALFQIMDNPQDCCPSVKETEAFFKDGALKVDADVDQDFEDALQESKIPAGAQEIINNAPCGGSLIIYKLVRDILGDNNALDHNLLDYVQEKFSDLLSHDDPETKKINIQTARKEIMHEVEIASGDKDSGKRWREIEANRSKVLEKTWAQLTAELYARLDDRKRGGLDYVVELIKAIQGRLQNPQTGMIGKLGSLVKQYTDVLDVLLGENGFNGAAERLAETKKGLLGGGVKKAAIIAEEMQTYLYWALRIKLLIKSTQDLATMYGAIVDRLGKATGTDDTGIEMYDGLLGDLMDNRAHVRATLDVLGAMVRRAEQQQNESYAMRIQLPVAEEAPTLDATDPEVIKDWAETVFGVTGSEEIFSKLKSQSDRLSFVNKMLDYADQKDSDLPNIRVSDLMKKMDSAQRLEQLRQLLRRGMPWGGLNKSHLKSDNYVVLLASGDSEFAKRYGDESKQSLPGIGINSDRVQFSPLSARSEQGKVVSYVQVDGFPLDNFQDLRRWRTSYRQVIQKLPVHTSKLARYRHPVIPTPDERRELKASLKIFYAAVMLGSLKRNPVDGVYTGVFDGSRLGCGTEVIRRNDPLLPDRLQDIGRMVQEQKLQLKMSAQRQAALIAWQYYLKAVYPKKPMGDGGGNDQEIKGQAFLYCEQLQKEWAREWDQETFLRDIVNAKALFREGDLVTPLLETFQMEKWVDFLPGSQEDADPAEINVRVQRDKCVLKPEVFEPGWLEQHVDYFRPQVQSAGDSSWCGPGGAVGVHPGGTPPPPPPPPGGVCFQADGNGWLSPLLGGSVINLGWHSGQAFWLPVGGQPLPAPQLSQTAQVPPPPGAGLVWSTDASGWQQPAWQSTLGVPPVPAKLGWYGNPQSPTPCWIAGGQSIPFTLAAAPVVTTPPPPPPVD